MTIPRETDLLVAVPQSESYEPVPRSVVIQQLTNRQMRWSQLIWCPNEQRWKPAREFHQLVGVQPTFSPPMMAQDAGVETVVPATAVSAIEDSSMAPPTQLSHTTEVLPSVVQVKPVVRSVKTKGKTARLKSAVQAVPEIGNPWEGYLIKIWRKLRIPIVAAIAVFATIYNLPLSARAALVDHAQSRQWVGWSALESLIFTPVESMTRKINLQDSLGESLTLNLSRPLRVQARLIFSVPIEKPIQLQIQGWCGTESKTLLMDQTLEIPTGTQMVRVFSVVAPKGNACFTCKGQEGALDQTVLATMLIKTDY
ncbi:MAG: hypothetical protein PHV34_23995 [Verrucomicrobiae bacterium]|nr:hypothetical protein [Verrucomicrobiae bacterium]